MENIQKFEIIILGVIFDPETRKILIGKAKGDKNWSFLEGNLKYNEELDVGLKKVAKEKTGYNVKNLGAIFAKNYLEKKDELEIYFLCEIAEGKEKKGENVEELKWIKPNKVEEYFNKKLPTRLKEYIMHLG